MGLFNDISCGVVLKRPNKNTVYVEKVGSNLNEVLKKSIDKLKNSVMSDRQRRKRISALGAY